MYAEPPLTLGAYRLIAELGHGGMADVFLAAVTGPAGSGFTKLAVIKKLRSHLAEDPEFVKMLMDEARITARLSHPNVVQLFQMGQVDDQYFLAMEYLDGQPLHRIERRASRLRPDLPRDVYYAAVSDMLAGLHHAHELADYDGTPLEIVHRDVTPHNVFVTYDGAVKVVDFGIAKAVGRATETRQGVVKGKCRYMSPEQVTGRPIDRRTDVFAAGVILFHAATNTKLWTDCDDVVVRARLAKGTYSGSPREICSEVPEAIDAICRKALAFRREDRYATAAAMQVDLDDFLGATISQARKQLAATVRELFDAERAKVRRILEASELSNVPSLPVFEASVGADSAHLRAARSSEPPENGAHTEIMPGAPARPAPRAGEPASVSATANPTDPRGARSARVKDGADRATSTRTRPARSPLGVAALAFASAAVVIAVGARAARPRSEPGESVPRPASTLVPELTTFAIDVRPKMELPRSSIAPHAIAPHAIAPHAIAPKTRVRDAAPSGAPTVQGTTSAAAPATAISPAPPLGSGKPQRPAPLDDADPWGHKP